MKRTAFFSIFLILLPLASDSGTHFLKLRANRHPGFLRIVIEGEESVINKGLVYQSKQKIIVTFPDTSFSVQTEQEIVDYKKVDQGTVMFSPGDFRGLKVFKLQHPARLVIDVYMKGRKNIFPFISPKEKEEDDSSDIATIVIDPGHGGHENGIVNEGNKEKNTVLDIAKKLGALVNSSSSRSLLTRGSDRFMSLSERVKYANSKDADVFLSIHVGNHSDIVIYTPVITDHVSAIVKPHLENKGQADYAEDTLILLKAVRKAVISSFGHDMVSIKPIPYSIASRIEAAALIVEFPSFEDAYYIEEMNTEIANTLYKGLYIYEETKAK